MGMKAKELKIKPISHSTNMYSHSLGKKSLDFFAVSWNLDVFWNSEKILFLFKVLIDYVKYFQILLHWIQSLW